MTGCPSSIRIGHSPDPDDAFMFYGFASGQVTIPGHTIQHVLYDIQRLNEIAQSEDPLEVTALSVHAFLELEESYDLLEIGTSVGRRYGPRVVARSSMNVAELAGRRIALPGPKTTATLVARSLLPAFEERHMDFTNIMSAVRNGDVDAGVLIHEGQLTYADEGLTLVADLGVMFAEANGGLPLPLGVNCVRGDLDLSLKWAIAEAYGKSVLIALKQRGDAVAYSLQFARGLSVDRADAFVGMYVNQDSLGFNDELKQAMQVLRSYYAGRKEATLPAPAPAAQPKWG